MFNSEDAPTLHSTHEALTLNATPDDGGHNDESGSGEDDEPETTPIQEQ